MTSGRVVSTTGEGWGTPLRLHLADGRVWHAVEFPSGNVAVNHPDEPNWFTIAVSIDGLLSDQPEGAPLHSVRVERVLTRAADPDSDLECWARPSGCPWPLACDGPAYCYSRSHIHSAAQPSDRSLTMPVRAKFRCTFETHKKWGPQEDQVTRSYEFMAMYDPDVPEDQRYAKATPSGSLTIQVDNPAVVFEPGKAYYLDVTPADEA